MKVFRLKRRLQIQTGPDRVKVYPPGDYPQGRISAAHVDHARKQHIGKWVDVADGEKVVKTPENKLADVPENKAGLGRKTGNRRRTRAKPDA